MKIHQDTGLYVCTVCIYMYGYLTNSVAFGWTGLSFTSDAFESFSACAQSRGSIADSHVGAFRLVVSFVNTY